MDNEKRLERLEDKVDKVHEELYELRTDFKVHTKLIEEHVAGDKKIITEISPIIAEFRYRQERERRIFKSLKLYGSIVAVATGMITLLSQVL